MEILDRVKSNINLCAVEIAFSAGTTPSSIEGWQPFYNTTFQDTEFSKAYAGLSSIEYSEESIESAAGTSHKQKISFTFPNSDAQRADRIALLLKVKFIKLKQTNGLDLIIGRNDFFQNTKPLVKVRSNEQLCQIDIESLSMFPSGYTPSFTSYGLPALIPITLL